MTSTEDRPGLRFDVDLHHCQLTPAEVERLRADLDSIERQVEKFPITDFHVLIEFNSRTTDYSVKTTLILPGARLVANDHDLVMHAAYQRCLDVLSENIRAYKDQLGQVPERQRVEKGTVQEVTAGPPPDMAAVEAAFAEGDYPAFRAALIGYEEALRKRIGRWVERYPQVAARIGAGLEVADLVEEVFLTAFEEYPSRPQDTRLGDWLEGLIDQSVKAIQDHGDEELENISRARTTIEAEQGREAV